MKHEENPPIQGIALADMLETLRQELELAQVEGMDRPVAFGIDKVELELGVVISEKSTGRGGLKFWVVTAGMGAESNTQRVHRFKLTLLPLDTGTKERLEVASRAQRSLDTNR